jgi:hypothetical protein
MTTRIELHVEELLLQGVASIHRDRIARSLERELARLFATQGVSEILLSRGDVRCVDAGAFQTPTGARPGTIGGQLGRAVFVGLNA